MKPRLRWAVRIEAADHPEGHALLITGRLGSTTTAQLAEALEAALAAGHVRVVLDCSGVDYISSAGLAVLERADDRLRAGGGALLLTGLQEAVRVAFEVSGAGSRFEQVGPAS